jgi:hypothetical protein
MSDRESPVAVIIRTTGSLVNPPPTTISNKLMTTPAISSALRATTVTQTPVRDARRTMVDGRERSRAEPFAVMPSPCKPWTPASLLSRMQPSAVCHLLNRGAPAQRLFAHAGSSSSNRGLLVQVYSCRTTLMRESWILRSPLYSMNPSLRNLFMKKLTRERVVPTISASTSCETLGMMR